VSLVVVTPTCRGSGSKVIALELAIHIGVETGLNTVLIDLSTDPSPFDLETNCLLAFLHNMIHSAAAFVRYDKASAVLISKLLTKRCKGMFKRNNVLAKILKEDTIDSIGELLQHLIYKDINVVLYTPPNLLGQHLFDELLMERGLINKAKVVVTSSERSHCLDNFPDHLERDVVKERIASIVVNKIPMGVIDNVKDEVVRHSIWREVRGKSLIASLIPLTMQLYYRNFASYIPLLQKAEYNEYAKVISQAMRRIVRTILGIDRERLILAITRGMISEMLVSDVTQTVKF